MRRKNTVKSDFKLLVGRKPIMDAIEDGISLEKIFIDRALKGPVEIKIRKTAKERGIPLKVVPQITLDKMSSANHQGVLAQIANLNYHDIQDVLYQAFSAGKMPLIGVLDGVTDVHNFGAIARSAEFFGLDGLLISSSRSAAINDLAMKTSAGALARIPVARTPSLVNIIPELKAAGLAIYSADVGGKVGLKELDWNRPIAIILGSEGLGVTPEISKQADEKFLIPKVGDMESLNVSVAAGICFYESMLGRAT